MELKQNMEFIAAESIKIAGTVETKTINFHHQKKPFTAFSTLIGTHGRAHIKLYNQYKLTVEYTGRSYKTRP